MPVLGDAGALLAASASAQAGITIPAGDWTLDIGGVVNAYYTHTRHSGNVDATDANGGLTAAANDTGTRSAANITTGLLPNYLTVSGKSRQNDLDIGFTISINPGGSTNSAASGGYGMETRQQFLTIGDASWGSVKFGKDLGIFASDAILNDMTLLGVGSASGNRVGSTTTLGRIGTGYIYADWKNQIAYTSPNWNGFQFTAGMTQAFNQVTVNGGAASTGMGGGSTAYEAKASYSWTGDVAGKVWVSGISQKIDNITGVTGTERATAMDIGANVNAAGFGLTGYYFNGNGIGHQAQMFGGLDNLGKKRDSDGWYVQGTYVLPTATKLGVSYGESKLDMNRAEKTLKVTLSQICGQLVLTIL
jgi:predicted porin